MRTRITRGPANRGTAENNGEKPSNNSGDRPRRPFREGGDRPRRPFGEGGDRPRRPFGEGGDRPRRPFGEGGDRPRRPFGEGGDRPRRPFGEGGDRPRRPFGEGGDRPRRPFREGGDRPRRPYGEGGDRPRRPYGEGGDRPRRPFGEGGDRPRRPFGEGGDRPRRPYGEGGDRPRRPYGEGGDRPRRPFGEGGDRPRRPYGEGGDRPRRDHQDQSVRKKGVKPEPKQPSDPNTIRLNKFISNSGVCSRREADDYISAGLVTVNGVIVTELGTKININDEVRFNNERLKGENKVYIIMNKPKDFVTTTSDPHAEKNVMDLINPELCPERIFPVGRLDKSTTGVLLFTNDGTLTETLTHPSYQRKKIYQVTLDKNLKKSDFEALLQGVQLEDGEIVADSLSYIGEHEDQVGIEIHSGRNRVVRRMFEHFGYDVKKLDRVYFAGLTKKNIRRGQWRFLTEQEVAMLKMGSYE